jgi:uncharacterized protein YjbJ (UPF0337 family)
MGFTETEGDMGDEPLAEKLEEAVGGAKEAAGDLTDNEDLERKGKVEKMGAKAKQAVSSGVDKVKDAVSDDED